MQFKTAEQIKAEKRQRELAGTKEEREKQRRDAAAQKKYARLAAECKARESQRKPKEYVKNPGEVIVTPVLAKKEEK